MCDEQVAAYASGSTDAGTELAALGLDTAKFFMLHLQRILVGKRRYKTDRIFHTHDGIDVYKADYLDAEKNNCFVLYVVEDENDGTLRITVMQAGRTGDFVRPDEPPDIWSESALDAIKAEVEPRIEDFFQ
ncbi:hypothetical protein FHS78_001381 [Parvibaculum indicum]|uniref:hypothetical protein n=1 Tax=Parvibaculum indicum TaxID=562969 RepID=UPI00142486BF|nr:hypothetical protein [Parvibaculum indicum]NIJ41100.1 hypothetical protein [Parvibaculum indicum]